MGGRPLRKKTTVDRVAPLTDENRPLTTGQCAVLCYVAPRTVSKWFDSGRLKGFRIPGSLDRRVMPVDLLEFLREHEMPEPPELVACVTTPVVATVVYGVERGFTEGVWFDDPFELGAYCVRARVVGAVLGDDYGLAAMAQAVRIIRSKFPVATVSLVIGDDVTVGNLESVGLGGEKWGTRTQPTTLPFTATA